MTTATATNTSTKAPTNTEAPDTAHLSAAHSLQSLLPQLVALTLDAKQAHWNVTGPAFLPLHALTDELAADTRTWADRAAERAVALGSSVDARPSTVASSVTAALPAGWLSDQDVITGLAGRLAEVADAARQALPDLERWDAVAHDLVVEFLEGVEKYRWMLVAHNR